MAHIIKLLIIICYGCISCGRNPKVGEDISKLISKSIVIPDNLSVVYDSDIDIEASHNVLKYIIYADSTSCTPCDIDRIDLWEPLIKYSKLLDENGDFERLNPHLPKNKAMHTFLLDENNKVILVGNPLQSKEIEKLFYKITQELLAK